MNKCTIFFITIFIFLTTSSPENIAAAPSYVGTNGCSCHKSQITNWEMSVHGKAFDALKPGVKKLEKKKAKLDPDKDYTKDKKCLPCHTTGYQKQGGFRDMASTPEMAGVGCEMCHGPGSEYKNLHDTGGRKIDPEMAKAYGQRYGSQDRAVCENCHTHKDSPFEKSINKKYEFDWKERLEKRKTYHRKPLSFQL